MVDVPASYGGLLASHLKEDGWSVERTHADGADALSVALQRGGYNAVLYGGDGPGAVPARKALALVRLADPYLPFLVVSPNIRRGSLSSVVRGPDDAARVVSDPKLLSAALTKELEATRLRRRVGNVHHLLLAQQSIGGHLAAGLEPDALCERVLATLGEALGWSMGAVWRPAGDGAMLTLLRRLARRRRARGGRRVRPVHAGAALRAGSGHARPRVGVPAAGVGARRLR